MTSVALLEAKTIEFNVVAVMTTLVAIIITLLWFAAERKPKSAVSPAVCLLPAVNVPTLCKYDFNGWYFRLLHALITEGTIEAIKGPLPVFDHRNLAAFLRIDDSVPL